MRVPLSSSWASDGGLHNKDIGLVRFGWRTPTSDILARHRTLHRKGPHRRCGGDSDWYGYCLDDPVNGRDPEGLELVGSQVRKGDESTLYYYDPDTGDNFMYDLKEPAPKISPINNEKYGPNAKLPPGDYEKKPMSYSGKIMKTGHPLYTTPGSPAGIVITPEGTTRTVIGAHRGKKSEGCPLFDARKAGAQERSDSLKMLERYHMPRGGVRVRVREDDEN